MHGLLDTWRDRARMLRQHAHEPSALVYDMCAHELEEALQAEEEEVLTLGEASAVLGYSQDHHGRLVRDGKIGNVGRKGAPRVKRSDVPVKAGWVGRRERPAAELDRREVVLRAIGRI